MRYHFLDVQVDEVARTVCRARCSVPLEPKAFDLLVYLIRQRHRVVLKHELFHEMWPAQVVSDVALSRCVMLARQAAGDTGQSQRVIQTFHRRGFRFIASVHEREHRRRRPPLQA